MLVCGLYSWVRLPNARELDQWSGTCLGVVVVVVVVVVAVRLHVGHGGGARDDLDELGGDDGLAGSVVLDVEFVDHLVGVLCGVLHGAHAGALLGRGVLEQAVVNVRGKVELLQHKRSEQPGAGRRQQR